MSKTIILATLNFVTRPPNFFDLMWYVYILQSDRDYNLYVGMTNDLRKRVESHNQGKVLSTKNRIPLHLIYYEAHHNKYDAAAREQFLKSGWGKNWIKKSLQNYLNLKKLGGQETKTYFHRSIYEGKKAH